MIEGNAHAGFILAAYLLTAVVLVGMIAWIVIDGRAQRRRIADLEARGVRRRSAGTRRMTATDETPKPRRPRLVFLLPLAVFVALAAIFLIRLETGGNPEAVPSALVGKPAPDFDLPPLEGVGRAGPQGQPTSRAR